MSIEKLRAELHEEVVRAEEMKRITPYPSIAEREEFKLSLYRILSALLDEHEGTRENDGASWVPDSYSAFREAEEAIQRYGESE